MAKFGPFRVPQSFLDVWGLVRALAEGLLHLTFGDNFDSWEVEETISATSTNTIRNEFTDGTVPTRYIIVRQTGDGLVTADDTTAWSSDFVYMQNHGSNSVTVKIIFLR